MSKKPKIGYTTPNLSFDPLQWAIALAIRLGGGVPVRLKPTKPCFDDDIQGLVIGGGTDLHPELYAFDPRPGYRYDEPRDKMEIEWLRRAQDKNLPVLGICRGAQMMNVARGGALHIDIGKVYEDAQYPGHILGYMLYRKPITIVRDSLLYRVMGREQVQVNSLHKQAIDRVGTGLVVTAAEDNGIVQAIEDPAQPYFLGVQFHPEILIHKSLYRSLFKALVEAARGR